MAPHVDKAKTAFLFFQRDQLAAVKNELGGSMGEAMQEVCLSKNNVCFMWLCVRSWSSSTSGQALLEVASI